LFEPASKTFGQELLRPHRAYSPLLKLMEKKLVKGCAHITGGGFQENIDRILPSGCNAVIDTCAWTPEPIFEFLRNHGNVSHDEMYRTFNMGIGMVLIVDTGCARQVLEAEEIREFEPVLIGEIREGTGKVEMKYQ
jgi:phosphoribosylformylglycinamidine cyclo-ligase